MKISSKLRILIADDDRDIALTMKNMLRKIGFKNILDANDGKHALQTIEHQYQIGQPIELLFVDWMMPKLDGLSLTKILRANAAYNTLPIIVMSNKNEKDDIIKPIIAGASNYLVKPFSTNTVYEKIQQSMKWKEKVSKK